MALARRVPSADVEVTSTQPHAAPSGRREAFTSDGVQDLNDTETFEMPADDPGAVLGRLVKRLRLRYSRSFVSSRVANHTEPNSLLALVEVAAEIGMKITAARTDASGLAEVDVPVVVHFSAPDGKGGFGILERVTASSFLLWDSRSGRRHVDRDVFLAHWSGVVGLVERDDSRRIPETGYLQHRLLESLAGSAAPPALAGSRAAPALRTTLFVLTGSLLVIAAADHPADTRIAAVALMALTAIGFAVSTVMAAATSDYKKTLALPGCPRGRLVNCESVLTSPYSRIAGIPLSEIGVGFFGAILMLVATTALLPGALAPWATSGLAYLLALPFALFLVAVQIFMRQFCTLCLLVHGVIAFGAVISSTFLADFPSSSDLLPSTILLAVFLLLILFLAIPLFTRIGRMNEFVASQQRIAASPFATLAHVLTERGTELRGTACGIRLDGPPSPHELVLFVHPTCAQCSRAIDEARSLAASGRADVFVAVAPRDKTQAEREACGAVVAVGLALGSEAMLGSYAHAKKDFTALLAGDPVRILAEELSLPSDRIQGVLKDARGLIRRTEEFAEAHIEGTPAIFFNSRLYPYAAPLDHLSMLLQGHPELLEPTILAAATSLHGTKEVAQT
jgi:uncharacterized membrane protein